LNAGKNRIKSRK